MKLKIAFAVILICIPVLLHAERIDGIVAVVDDRIIMHSDLIKKIHELGADEKNLSSANQVLQLMIQEELVDKVYRSMSLPQISLSHAQEVAKALNVDIATAHSMIKKNTLTDLMVISRVVITEAMIKEYFDSHKEFSGKESLHLKQILIKGDEEKAKKAMADIRRGVSFDQAAKTYSDILVGDNPDIGWLKIDDIATDARTALEKSKPGDVIGPINLDDNRIIFQVLERGISGGKSIEEVRSEILVTLQEKYRNEAFDHWLKMIMAEHFIGVYL